VDTDNQGHHSLPQPSKHGVLRAYALIILIEAALIALLWAAKVPWGVSEAILILALAAALLGKHITGSAEHIQISSPTFISRIRNRYRSESNQLENLGFSPLFYYGEAFPLLRLLLIYPAFLFLIMLLNREVAGIQNGSKLMFGFPIFNSADKTTYAHPLQLGMKYHTLFQDGTILMTKNFSGKTTYGPRVVLHTMRNASISDAWSGHLKQIQALEATGKQIDRDINFQAYSDISRDA
jgi:hypothetical protein